MHQQTRPTSDSGGDPPTSYALPRTVDGLALFLDIDGTLIDIAPTPDAVVVPDRLPDLLRGLVKATDGALALVTGRSLAFLDTILATDGICVAGLHGAERRDAAGKSVRASDHALLDRAKMRLAAFAAATPGLIYEDKGGAIALHFRQAPDAEQAVILMMERIAGAVGAGFVLQHGKCVVELRPAGHDKGDVLRGLMAAAPFAGRKPLAIGDDLTDEAMFAAANELGGYSMRVGLDGRATAARGSVASPAVLRAWMETVL